jgi:phosphoribosylformylglycinamidine synthase
VAATVDCPNRWVALDPERGAMAAVAEAARNLSCTGAEPLAVTDNLNFPSPDTATGYWQLAMACRGLSEACSALATPVTGGNVSLYNETRLPDGRMQPIHPTPVVGMVGLVHDLGHVTGLAWQQPGDAVWLLGVPLDESGDERLGLAASSYLEVIHGRLTGRPPRVDLALEGRVQGFLRQAIAAGLVRSAHDLSDGGLAVALAEACIASGLGARLDLPASGVRPDRLLFAEGGARLRVSVAPPQAEAWAQALAAAAAAGEPISA